MLEIDLDLDLDLERKISNSCFLSTLWNHAKEISNAKWFITQWIESIDVR